MLENPEIWLDGGLTGIAILLIVLIGVILKYVYKLITNHMAHSDVIHEENVKVSGQLVEVIKTNSKVIDRVVSKLDKS